MLAYGRYLDFLYHLVSGNLFVGDSKYLNNDFFLTHLNNSFRWKGKVSKEQQLYNLEALKDTVDFTLQSIQVNEELKISRSQNFLSNLFKDLETEIKLRLKNEKKYSEINSFEIDFLQPYPLIIRTKPTEPLCPKLEYFSQLTKNIAAISLDLIYILLKNLST